MKPFHKLITRPLAYLPLPRFFPLSIVVYCSSFLRVRLEPANEQKKKINALENNDETTSSDVPNQLAKKTRGKFVSNLV